MRAPPGRKAPPNNFFSKAIDISPYTMYIYFVKGRIQPTVGYGLFQYLSIK